MHGLIDASVAVQPIKAGVLNRYIAVTKIQPFLDDAAKLRREDNCRVISHKECRTTTETRKRHGKRIFALNSMLIEVGRIDLANELVVTDGVNQCGHRKRGKL